MSRFYETLKQASQSLNSLPEDAGSAGSDISATLTESEACEAAAVPAEEPRVVASEQLLPRPATPRNDSFGISTRVTLDKKVRLIPNAADQMIVESYRSLRTKILQKRAEKMFRSLLITSSGPKEGKTLTVLNLALTFAMLPSFKVLVVDGDIRVGRLSGLLGIDQRPGLSNLLEGSAKLEEVVLNSSEIPFCFMARGQSKLSAPELLHSAQWATQARRISEHFDLVLVDSPPTGLVTDAQQLASGCDAVLLVARAFLTSRGTLEKICQDFQQFRVIGAILNGGEAGVGGYGGYRHYRSYYTEGRR